jgi:RNA polymerase sigma-70 factor (family 1)
VQGNWDYIAIVCFQKINTFVPDMTTDYKHLELFRFGDRQGLIYYMEQFLKPLSFYAGQLVKEQEVAEEIVQDSFVKLWELRDRFASEDHIKHFLYTVTKHACLNHLGAAQTRWRSKTEPLSESMLEPAEDVLTGMIHAETIALIYQELEQLPEQQSRIFKLVYFEGLTTAEVCAQLGITENAVFLAKSRAIKALKHNLKGAGLAGYLLFLQTWV